MIYFNGMRSDGGLTLLASPHPILIRMVNSLKIVRNIHLTVGRFSFSEIQKDLLTRT